MPDAIQQNKRELLAKVRAGRAIWSSLESISLCRIDHTPHCSIAFFVLAKEPIWYSRSQTSNLNPIKSENTAFIKRIPRSSALNHPASYSLRHWWSGASPSINCGCLLRVPRCPPLRFMSSNTNWGLRHQTHLYSQLFLHSLPPAKTLQRFSSFLP